MEDTEWDRDKNERKGNRERGEKRKCGWGKNIFGRMWSS